ncbi:sulfate ABC transporter substrate-binding protein [Candidatus Thiothrix sp. Deng01]|uniref:Sulfate-binding protein n=1 Tax=Candidatus Thiothrix phosphatis TaxID=3112415 RepID=A0ABU6CY68_9GAMM|nr:sulfate ABC transporter substrate-binding protein [Candidatus Thiothrix sp. Deng01]MEB4591734.1 sulfate ABC transporter substrate-binding protein [Candidatus Thiothrix sp. Deng01]
MAFNKTRHYILALTLGLGTLTNIAFANDVKLRNVSYDPTRELYADYNAAFAKYWKEKTGDTVAIEQSHAGSAKQARALLDGLEGDVATLALGYDIDSLYTQGNLLSKDWQAKLPDNSTPYTSTIVFLVRKGNPKGIKDWPDLAKEGVEVVTPNPKTSGGARWNYLAAWGYALKQPGGNDETAKAFVKKIFDNVKVLDTGARGSTTTFTQRGVGDVLVTWENEAYLVLNELGKDDYEIVTPSLSILTEPPVAVVTRYATQHGTEELAKAYLEHLYSPEGQDIIGKHYFRPRDAAALAKYKSQFAPVKLFTLNELFGDWSKAQSVHFSNGGTFDQIKGQ